MPNKNESIYIIFLRAVNVSGKNLIKMADLKAKLLKSGFKDVQTYIQSGNIVLKSDLNKVQLTERINKLIMDEFGLDLSIFILSEAELNDALQNCPFPSEFPGNRVFITFLNKKPQNSDTDNFKQIDLGEEKYHLHEQILYFYLPDGMANSKLNNNFIEKKLKVIATGRNTNTVNKMLTLISK